jgi:hypothetical protein
VSPKWGDSLAKVKQALKEQEEAEMAELAIKPKPIEVAELPTVICEGKKRTKRDIEDLLLHCTKNQPQYPSPEDCCGTGCDPCVYDSYERKMSYFEEKKCTYEALLLEFEE